MGLFDNFIKITKAISGRPTNAKEYNEKENEFYKRVAFIEDRANKEEAIALNKFLNKSFTVDGENYKPYKPALNPVLVIKEGKAYKNVNRLFKRMIIGELEETGQFQKNIAMATRASYELHSNMPLSEFEKQGYLKNVKLVNEVSKNNPNLKIAVYSDKFKIGYIAEKDNKTVEWMFKKRKQSLNNKIDCKAQIMEYQGQKEIIIEVTFSFSELGYVTTLDSMEQENFNKLIEWYSKINENVPLEQVEKRISNIEYTIAKKFGITPSELRMRVDANMIDL